MEKLLFRIITLGFILLTLTLISGEIEIHVPYARAKSW